MTSTSQISFVHELARKGTHLGALIIPAGYHFLNLEKLDMLAIMIPVAILIILMDISRLRRWRFWTNIVEPIAGGMVRKHEAQGDFTGATYILISVCFTVALYEKPVAIAALAFIMIGDTLAALIGRKFGRIRYGRKSLEGSVAFLAGTAPVIWLAPELALSAGLFGAIIATITEAFSIGIDDNISVPIISGLAMTLFIKIL